MFCSSDGNVIYGWMTIVFIFVPSIATFLMKDAKRLWSGKGRNILKMEFWHQLPFISLLAHTLAHIHGCGGKITRFITAAGRADRQQRRRISCLGGRALPVSVSLIDDPFYRLITVYITLIENLPTTPIRGMCVCVSQTQPHPPFFSKFWLVHVANVQVDYADKGRKGHMILAMSSCVVDFAEGATGPGKNYGEVVG